MTVIFVDGAGEPAPPAVWPNSESWVGKQAQQQKFIHPPKVKTTSTQHLASFQSLAKYKNLSFV